MGRITFQRFAEAKPKIYIKMNTKIALNFAVVLTAALTLASCQKTDEEAPTVCTPEASANSILADEIEAMAGDHLDIEDVFCDNEGLSEVRYDIHSAAGHAHEGEEGTGEDDHGLILHSGTDWEVLETLSLTGTEAEVDFHTDVPNTARGIWDVIVSIVDEEGNVASDYITKLHVENDYIPEFTLTSVGGTDPSEWHDEPVWAPGADINVVGTVSDSDGIASAVLEFIDEATETVIWEVELAPAGETEFAFDETVSVPADLSGECHFEMKATDGAGNETETGFHVEVE